MEDDPTAGVSQNFIPPVLRPPMYPTHTVVKNSSAGYFGVSSSMLTTVRY